ncbi:Uncharacterized protein PHSC3_000708 [Chlamydiales bacterium STE3]|nr:Uncharacterized protein PHSC3_000708 [Chlamydiales bacterium STE3]
MMKRSYEKELIDLGPSHYSKEEYEECLTQLARIGRFLGGDRATLQSFKNLRNPQSILDVGCGGGHFTAELARRYPNASLLGIDLSAEAIAYAQKQHGNAKLNNLQFVATTSPQLTYETNQFDVVTTTLVCHHMTDQQLITFLKEAYRVAKHSVIINDLHRHWLAYFSFACIAKPFFPNRLIFQDGLLSIKRGFKKKEWVDYLHAAEIPLKHCHLTWHWAFRWILKIDTSYKT